MPEFEDKLTKGDLIDYVVTKKVEELKVLLNKEKKRRNDRRDELYIILQDLRSNLQPLFEKECSKYITSTYGSTIKAIEKNLNCTHTVLSWNDSSNNKNSMTHRIVQDIFNVRDNEAMIIFKSPHDDIELFGNTGNHAYYDRHPIRMVMSIKSMIRVNLLEVTNPKIEKIQQQIKDANDELNTNGDRYSEIVKEISIVKDQKDMIKNTIIEQTLNSTDNGKRLLEALSSIKFDKGNLLLP